ncbi:MAG: preprotein translocase subunit YajC [Treponema sp.]|jgi:preprotein translocase subunit YajC|nr:preprotein translocase subunit YajC [Treponema sp.]
MNNFVFSLLMAAPQAAEGAPAQGSFITSIIPFALIIVIFYFLLIRPQNKKRKETENMLSALKKGDKIVTIGGIHGTVQNVRESTVLIKVDDNVKIEFLRSAVSSVVTAGKEVEDKSGEKEDQSSETGE